jgi:hypothetical protein
MPKDAVAEQILLKMGLSDGDLQDAEAKFADLVKTLSPAQIKTLQQSTPTAEAAAKTFGPEVTAECLMEFIRSHAPRDAAMVMIFNGSGL